MSREVLGVGGAVVGAVVGGPVGAQIGFMVGSTIGGYLFPEVIPGARLGDIPLQTSRDGVPIPIGWGIVYLSGNVIQINPIQEVITRERQGKGGGGTVVEYVTYYRTFAIGLCRSISGPIKGVLRIWENDKLVYDMRDTPAIPYAETQAYAENITIYLGTEDQTPDPELEAHMGTGNQPYYKGLAYIVWNNYDITNFAGAIPQYKFEIEVQGPDYVTSRPYALDPQDSLQIDCAVDGGVLRVVPFDTIGITAGFGAATWQQIRFEVFFEDYVGISAGFGDATWTTLVSREYFEDYVAISTDNPTITWDRILVEQIMAPDKLQIGISAPTGSMTAV